MREHDAIEEIGNTPNDRFRSQHANVDGLNLEVSGKFSKGVRDYAGANRLYPLDPLGRLHGQSGNACQPVTLVGSDGLDVGGNSRP